MRTTWKMCRCEHYQTQHVMPEVWESGRGACAVKGCGCVQYHEQWITRKQRKLNRKHKHLLAHRRRIARERAAGLR